MFVTLEAHISQSGFSTSFFTFLLKIRVSNNQITLALAIRSSVVFPFFPCFKDPGWILRNLVLEQVKRREASTNKV